MIRIAILGAAGRMGRMLIRQVAVAPDCALSGAADRPGSDALGQDAGLISGIAAQGIKVTDDVAAVIAAADVAIDFTSPAATVAHAGLAAQHGTALVIGTTGFDPQQLLAVAHAGQSIPIVIAANFSVGVVLLQSLIRQAAQVLGPETDIEIVEMHHRMKVDAPSGTALALGEAAAAGRRVILAEAAVRGRDGLTGARAAGTIGFAALRGGDVVGDHTVIFAGDGERIEFTHKASSREIFAQGAVRAAQWVVGKPQGRYGMTDVLGLTE